MGLTLSVDPRVAGRAVCMRRIKSASPLHHIKTASKFTWSLKAPFERIVVDGDRGMVRFVATLLLDELALDQEAAR